MANEEHLAILKQGVKAWNEWRHNNRFLTPNFTEANLRGANLSLASLTGIDFTGAILAKSDLTRADLVATNLTAANLRGADLSGAYLGGADLMITNFNGPNLGNTNFENARFFNTVLAYVDLSSAQNLATVKHGGPSTIGIDTIYKSHGKIPEIFLRGCGVPENLIAHFSSFVGNAIEFYSCFISYSHKDKDFARLLHDRLQGDGIRCWLDEHHLNPGDPLHQTIYEGIRVYDKILLCCSETALTSWWVEKEFTRGVKKEEDYDQHLIIPINLDGYLFKPECTGWVQDEVKQRLVADFTGWKDHDSFEQSFKGIVKVLRTDGGKPPAPGSKLKGRGRG